MKEKPCIIVAQTKKKGNIGTKKTKILQKRKMHWLVPPFKNFLYLKGGKIDIR